MNNQPWKKTFTLILLGLASLTLGVFSFSYFLSGNIKMAIIEGSFSLLMLFTFTFLTFGGNYFISSLIGYLGVISVLEMLLILGGIGNTGIIWWGLLPVMSYVMFGLSGGRKGLLFGLTVLLFSLTLSYFSPDLFAFTFVQIRQTIAFVLVSGIIMHFFEKTAGTAREKVFEEKRYLEQEVEKRKITEEKLSKTLEEIKEKNTKQDLLRAAMINLLEDERELDEELKKEKEGIEKEVLKRTQELQEEKSKLFAVVNSLSRGIIVINKEHKIILHNKGITNVLNIVESDIHYSHIQKIISPLWDINEVVTKTFETKEKILLEPKILETRYLTLHSIPIIHNNSVEEVILFVSDVTEEINLQRSRDEFFSIASHELRTPLTAIRGNAEMILDNYAKILPNKDIQEMLFDIRDGSLRLTEIVNDFLDLSRLEMKKIDFKNETLEISQIIHEIIKEMEKTNIQENTKVYFDNESKSAIFVTGDKDRIKQVLINLIGNALKFTQKGSVHIALEILEKEQVVEVSVTDSGNGIAPEQQNLLFHKFQQAGPNLYTRDTTRGTGLGLYICKLLMEGMNGKIWLKKSMVGEGSTFCFSLHLAKTPQT